MKTLPLLGLALSLLPHASSADQQPAPTPANPPQGPRIRHSVETPAGKQMIELYRRGVEVMKSRQPAEVNSWQYQANMHNFPAEDVKPGEAEPEFWGDCEHWTPHFLSWHRMYLFHFEAMVREACGDASFTLPYWNYSAGTQRTIPEAFRVPDNPGNALFHANRNPSLNDPNNPWRLSPFEVETESALGETYFFQFQNALEETPHGSVHVAIGGSMGTTSGAARDPIFWLHHANIDRLWEAWLRQGGGRTNPASADWKDQSFGFFDSGKNRVTMKASDIENTSGPVLNYVYDSFVTPGDDLLAAARVKAGDGEALAGAPPDDGNEGKALATAAEPTQLRAEKTSVKLDVAPESLELLKNFEAPPMAPGGAQAPPRLVIRLSKLEYEGLPLNHAVFLNLPAGAALDPSLPNYLGVISFFGRKAMGMPGEKPAGEPVEIKLPLGRKLDQLAALGQWDGKTLQLQFTPILPVPPQAGEGEPLPGAPAAPQVEALKAQASPLKIGSITLEVSND